MVNIFKNIMEKRSLRNCQGNEIDKEDLNKFIKQDAILIDVRSPQEFKEGHIDDAICIPDYKIKREIEKIVPNKEQLIVLYCSTGTRSKKTECILENMGYQNVYNLKIEII